jgi:hypothetical protein
MLRNNTTEHFTDLGHRNLGQAKFPDGFRLEQIFNSVPDASKNNAWFKNG